MQREILFKGKRVDNGKWVEGDLFNVKKIVVTTKSNIGVYTEKGSDSFKYEYIEVDPETVCQFTGLTDKNGVKIFEGDILKHRYKDDVKGVVSFYEGSFTVGIAVTFNALINFNAPKNLEVIGNIHDL